MKTHIRNWLSWEPVMGVFLGVFGFGAFSTSRAQQDKDETLGAISVFTTTNFVGVSFAPIQCLHPGCAEGHHSFTATESYMIVRDTWAEVVGTGENRRIYSDTNDWGSLQHQIAHPAVYRMHTEPGHPVRPGTRWPNDMPPLPTWETYKRVARRSNAATLPNYASATNGLYGVLYIVTTNYPSEKLVLEKRGADRLSNVIVWPGSAVERYTNGVTSDGLGVWIKPPITSGRFRAVPATTELPGARRFTP